MYVWRIVRRVGSESDDENGDGAEDESEDGVNVDGCGKLMWIPCTPTVQSRYDVASSKFVSSEMLRAPRRTEHAKYGQVSNGAK